MPMGNRARTTRAAATPTNEKGGGVTYMAKHRKGRQHKGLKGHLESLKKAKKHESRGMKRRVKKHKK